MQRETVVSPRVPDSAATLSREQSSAQLVGVIRVGGRTGTFLAGAGRMPGESLTDLRDFNDEAFLVRDSPDRPHALIAVGTARNAETAAIARALASHLESGGFIVELADASTHAMPLPPDYELVVIGLSSHSLHDHALVHWVEVFSEALGDVASALFVIGHQRSRLLDRLAASGWRPHAVTSFPRSDRPGESLIASFAEELRALVATHARA